MSEKSVQPGKVKVKIVGKAVCHFVRIMEVYEDELDELLADEEMQTNNLDHPDAAYAVVEWTETEALKQ